MTWWTGPISWLLVISFITKHSVLYQSVVGIRTSQHAAMGASRTCVAWMYVPEHTQRMQLWYPNLSQQPSHPLSSTESSSRRILNSADIWRNKSTNIVNLWLRDLIFSDVIHTEIDPACSLIWQGCSVSFDFDRFWDLVDDTELLL